MIEIIVPGKPRGKGRPRFGAGHAYTPASTRRYEHEIAVEARRAVASCPDWDKSVAMWVYVIATLPVPKSWSGLKRAKAEDGCLFPMTKPDIDNIAKAALDAINGIVFDDDKQVVKLEASKAYCARSATNPLLRDGYLQVIAIKAQGGEA